MTEPHKIWIEQCEAAENIEAEFGTQKALDYLIGEKFLNFLEAAETHADVRAEIPDFVGKTTFGNARVICYWWSGQESGFWRTEIMDESMTV